MTPKRVFYLMIGILVATLLAGAASFYFSDQNLTKRSEEISRLSAENEVLDIRIATINAAEKNLNQLSDIDKSIDKILPPEKIQSDIVAQIFAIAADNGVSLNRLSFPNSSDSNNFETSQTQPLPGVNGVRYTSINTDFLTTYSNLLNFLDDIENNKRIMQVASVNVTPSGVGKVSVSLEIQVFVRS